MFFVLSKLLDLLLAPLSWAILLVVASVALRRRRVAPWLGGAAAVVLCLFSLEPVANELTRIAEAPARRTLRPDVTYDAVIVLGGGIDPAASKGSGEPELGPAGDRILAGWLLFHDGRARNVLVSAGGSDPGEPVEGDWTAAIYRRLGVPEDRLVVERTSRNTRENAVNSLPLVRERGWKTLLLVTSAMHAPRAEATFRRAGLAVDVFPVDRRYGPKDASLWPRASALDRSTEAIRELAGRVAYRAAGYAGP